MAAPTPLDVCIFLGRDDQDAELVNKAATFLGHVTAFVKAYTGGRGFDPSTGQPTPDIASVIITATARLIENPTHTVSEAIGSYSIRGGTFEGWNLPELAVLHRYRRRAA